MILYILLIAHLLADFTFQSESLTEKKAEEFKYLIKHSVIYTLTLGLIIFIFIEPISGILPFIIIATSHFIIDLIKQKLVNHYNRKRTTFFSFLIDQLMHILTIALIVSVLNLDNKPSMIYNYCQSWEYFDNFIIYTLIIVVIWDPSAVFIKKLFEYIDNDGASNTMEKDPPIGRVIGKLERLIISTLVLYNQFAAIGFVLAAKSIARYKQLEDKAFAEKYLVGTLASTAIALLTTILLKNIL